MKNPSEKIWVYHRPVDREAVLKRFLLLPQATSRRGGALQRSSDTNARRLMRPHWRDKGDTEEASWVIPAQRHVSAGEQRAECVIHLTG